MSEPITREEMYFAALGGEAVTLPDPLTREELYLAYLNGMTDTYPDPITRTEQYLYKLCQNGMGSGGGVTIRNQNKTITENGSYKADSGYTGLGTVTVNVPQEEPVLQDKTVTENGTVTADSGFDGLGVVTVNVESSGGGEDTMAQFLKGTLTEYSNSEVTNIRENAFYTGAYGDAVYASLERISFPNVTTISKKAFQGQNKLVITSDSFPKVTSIGDSAFNNCKADSVTFENITTLTSQPFASWGVKELRLPNAVTGVARAFRTMRECTNIYIPKVENAAQEFFQNCSAITHICMPALKAITNVNSFFSSCSALTAFILPGATMATIAGALVLPSANTFVYVPANLLETYRNATNWATIADSIRAIEDYAEILQWLADNGYEYEVTT